MTGKFSRPLRPTGPLSDKGGKAKRISGLIGPLMPWCRFCLIALIALTALMALLVPAYCEEPNKVLKVETKKTGNYSEVAVYTSRNVKPQVILLDSPNRVALAFDGCKIDSSITLSGPTDLIRIIQASQFDEKTVYVMIEPNEELNYEFTSIIGRNKYVIEFSRARPGSAKKIAPSETAAVSEEIIAEAPAITEEAEEILLPPSKEAVVSVLETKIPVVEKKMPPKPVEKKLPSKKAISIKKKAISLVTAEVSRLPLPLEGKLIVIDPGHGGRDPGYVGRSGIFEKSLTLKVALQLKQMLTAAGAKVLLSRKNDSSLKKKDIVALANENAADMLVCIHFNAYTSPGVSGIQSFYFNPNSKLFARVVQKNLYRTVQKRNRGIKKEIYYTIHHTNMPAVLVEAGYLTNPKEEKQILTPAYRDRIAAGIYKGIKEYVKISSKWQK